MQVAKLHKQYLESNGGILPIKPDLGVTYYDQSPISSDSELDDIVVEGSRLRG